jgi:outer membrane biosynthesis protein TonB
MNMFAKIAILCSLAVLVLPAPASEEPSAPSSQSEPDAAPPQTGQTPPPAQAPTAPQPQVESPPETQNPPPETQNPPPETQNNPPQAAPLPATPPKLKRRKNKTAATHTQSGKVVVKNGGAKDDSEDLAPAMSTEQARHSRESTVQLLASTDQNLKNVAGRQFSPAQQNMLEEIHTYVRQSKGATDSGDLTRAHTLAYKALLLSGELAKK